MKKKIIFFCPSIEDGGVEKNLFLMVNELVKTYNVSIITANTDKKKFFDNKVVLITPSLINIKNFFRIYKTIWCFWAGFMEISKYNKNLILIAYESNVSAIILSKFFNVPVIIRSNASPIGYINNFFKKFIFKFFFKFADIILVNSSEFKKQIDKILNIKSEIIYNSIITDKKRNILAQKKIIKIKIKNNCYKLITIGRLVEQKDQLTILKALNNIKNDLNFYLLILGKGKLKNSLKEYCIKNKIINRVKFVGYKQNIFPYLKWSDALILSSKYEGSPNVLIEGISMKKIIISSDCPTGPREILKKGKGGYLFKTSNFKDLASKIKISYFNKKLSKKKVDYIYKTMDKYDIEINKKKFLKLISSLK